MQGTELSNVATGGGLSGTCSIFNPSNATVYKPFRCEFAGYNQTTPPMASYRVVTAYMAGVGAVTGFSFQMSSGNITSGVIKVYGWN